MQGLTFADRTLLLQTLETLKDEWTGTDPQLLHQAGDWARALHPNFGFEHALARNFTLLSRYLIDHGTDNDVASIARGGLLYPLFANRQSSERLGAFGLLDVAFIASYAVHEIRTRLGEGAIYNPPDLRKDEQDRAEQLFLEFIDRPVLSDEDLFSAVEKIAEGMAGLVSCGFFGRFRNNINFLIGVLHDSGRKPNTTPTQERP